VTVGGKARLRASEVCARPMARRSLRDIDAFAAVNLLLAVGWAAFGGNQVAFAQAEASSSIPPQQQNATSQPNISGVWVVNEYVVSTASIDEKMLHTAEGKPAPLQPWAEKLYRERMEKSEQGFSFASTYSRCLPGGVPTMMLGARYPIQILQSTGQVTTVHEEQHSFRLIYLNEKHPADPDPTFMGHSTGIWESDTLVVDTVGLSEETTIDISGMPHTDQLHIVERIRRITPDTLEDIISLDDPKAFSAQWTLRRTYKLQPAGFHLMEYSCENQRNAPDADGHAGFTN
jgi:hypothetical protein